MSSRFFKIIFMNVFPFIKKYEYPLIHNFFCNKFQLSIDYKNIKGNNSV